MITNALHLLQAAAEPQKAASLETLLHELNAVAARAARWHVPAGDMMLRQSEIVTAQLKRDRMGTTVVRISLSTWNNLGTYTGVEGFYVDVTEAGYDVYTDAHTPVHIGSVTHSRGVRGILSVINRSFESAVFAAAEPLTPATAITELIHRFREEPEQAMRHPMHVHDRDVFFARCESPIHPRVVMGISNTEKTKFYVFVLTSLPIGYILRFYGRCVPELMRRCVEKSIERAIARGNLDATRMLSSNALMAKAVSIGIRHINHVEAQEAQEAQVQAAAEPQPISGDDYHYLYVDAPRGYEAWMRKVYLFASQKRLVPIYRSSASSKQHAGLFGRFAAPDSYAVLFRDTLEQRRNFATLSAIAKKLGAPEAVMHVFDPRAAMKQHVPTQTVMHGSDIWKYLLRYGFVTEKAQAAAEPPANTLTKPQVREWCVNLATHGPALKIDGVEIDVLYSTGTNSDGCLLTLYGHGRGIQADATTDPAYMHLRWSRRHNTVKLQVLVVRPGVYSSPYDRTYQHVFRHSVDTILRGAITAYIRSPHGKAFLENRSDM